MRNKEFKIGSDPRHDGYQTGLASMVYKFSDKKSSGSGVGAEPNHQLVNKLQSKIIRKFKRQKDYSFFRDNIWGFDLTDMQSLSKYIRGINYLLCAIDLFSKYTWVALLKDKTGISIINTFQKVLGSSNKKQIKYGLIKVVNSITSFLRGFWK